MTANSLLKPLGNGQVERARAMTHRAAQHLTALARANLEAAPDDSHSSLIWADGALRSRPMGDIQASLVLADLVLTFERGGQEIARFALEDSTPSEADAWLDEQAVAHNLQPGSSVEIPYELPSDVAAVQTYSARDCLDGLASLATWYAVAATALESVREETARFDPGPSPVRCWPHHFDIATYIALEHGDPEIARGIGAGMSPGDESNSLPYLYVNPWPHLDASDLPDAVSPGHWHTEGYVGLIATKEEIAATSEPWNAIGNFLRGAVNVAVRAQGLV